MLFDEAFVRAVGLVIKKEVKATIISGKVKSISGNTCTVQREGSPDLLDVRLNAVVKSLNSQILIIPKQNSDVLCAVIDGLRTETFVVAVSEIDSFEVWFDNAKTKGFKITADGAVFDEGGNGGMTITPELKTQLDIMSARIDAIIDVLGQVPSGAVHPNTTAWETIYNPVFNALPVEDFSNIENERVKH